MSDDLPNAAALFKKIILVMAIVDRIEKKGVNTHFNYKFAAEGDVLDAVRTECVKIGLVILPGVTAGHRDGKNTVLSTCYTFCDSETGFQYTCPWQGEADDQQDKGTSKAIVSSGKYFLLKAFMIPTGEDPDALGPAKESKATPAAKSTPTGMDEDTKAAIKWLRVDMKMTADEYTAFTTEHGDKWLERALALKAGNVTDKTKIGVFDD